MWWWRWWTSILDKIEAHLHLLYFKACIYQTLECALKPRLNTWVHKADKLDILNREKHNFYQKYINKIPAYWSLVFGKTYFIEFNFESIIEADGGALKRKQKAYSIKKTAISAHCSWTYTTQKYSFCVTANTKIIATLLF